MEVPGQEKPGKTGCKRPEAGLGEWIPDFFGVMRVVAPH